MSVQGLSSTIIQPPKEDQCPGCGYLWRSTSTDMVAAFHVHVERCVARHRMAKGAQA
jgi:hypothetical protein